MPSAFVPRDRIPFDAVAVDDQIVRRLLLGLVAWHHEQHNVGIAGRHVVIERVVRSGILLM